MDPKKVIPEEKSDKPDNEEDGDKYESGEDKYNQESLNHLCKVEDQQNVVVISFCRVPSSILCHVVIIIWMISQKIHILIIKVLLLTSLL